VKVTIKQRSQISHTLYFRIPGDPLLHQETVPGNHKAAEKRAGDIERDYEATGGYQEPFKKKLGEYLVQWLQFQADRVQIDDLSPTTYEEYRRVIDRYWIPHFGNRLITAIRHKEVRQFYLDLQLGKYSDKPLSKNYVKNIHIPCCKALNDLVEDEDIDRNPLDKIKFKKLGNQGARRGAMQPDQVKELLELVKSHPIYSQQELPYYLVFYFAFFMGVRISEGLAMTWTRIDLNNQVAQITHGLHWFEGGRYLIRDRVKTEDSNRNVFIPDMLAMKLRRHREWQQAQYEDMECQWTPDELVFSVVDRRGERIRPVRNDTAGKIFKRFACQVGCPDATLHSTRHTHISILLNDGVSSFSTSKRAGHATAGYTETAYGHEFDYGGRETAARFNEIMARAGVK